MRRICYLDNLRAIAILMVVLGHSMLPYMPRALPHTLVRSNISFHFTLGLFYILHFLTMPIFFMLAGFFANASLRKYSIGLFLNEKLLRLALPTIIGIIIFMPVHYFFYVQDYFNLLQQFIHSSPVPLSGVQTIKTVFMQTISNGIFFKDFLDPEYLWFLLYLLFFNIICLFCYKFFPKLHWSNHIFMKLYGLPAVALLSILLFIGTQPIILLPLSVVSTCQSLFAYGFFFYLGWCVYGNKTILEQVKAKIHLYLIISIVSVICYHSTMIFAHDINTIIVSFTHALSLYFVMLTTFGLFARFINMHSKLLRYIADASFWMYLINIPVLLFMGLAFVNSPMNIFLAYFFTLICTFFIFVVTYELLIKRTSLIHFYTGKYQFKFIRRYEKNPLPR